MISNLNKQRFEYIWHLFNTNKTEKDLPFEKHVPCHPSVWQFPKNLIEYHDLVFDLGKKSLDGKTVLDLGCGNAWYLGCLENCVKEYTGVDIDTKKIKYAKIMSTIVDVPSTFIIDDIGNVKPKADTIMMLSVTQHIPNVKNIFEKFDCENVILDSFENLKGIHLKELVDFLISKGFSIDQKHEWKGSVNQSFGDRFILHFNRQA